MTLKNQISLFSIVIRLLLVIVLWYSVPFIIKKAVYKNVDHVLIERKVNFIKFLSDKEIQNYTNNEDLNEKQSTTLSEFISLKKINTSQLNSKNLIIEELRIVKGQKKNFRILHHEFNFKNQNYLLEVGNDLDEMGFLMDEIHKYLLAFFLFAILISHFANIYFISILLKPFQTIISKKINLINEPEFFNFEKVKSTSTDFNKLDDGLNEMMRRIQDQCKREKQFIGNVSHELLTPIAILKNRFENLLNNPSLNDEAVDKIDISLKNLDTIKRIINNLLLISRIENNQYSNFETINFKILISRILEDFEDRIEVKNIQITLKLNHDFNFKGNRVLLHVLFYNIINNAIKFTPSNGKILISDSFDTKNYKISVLDSGIGMTDEQVSKIFNRFVKINPQEEGQGLGLAIVSSIANLHKIEINVASKVKEGSNFEFLFNKS